MNTDTDSMAFIRTISLADEAFMRPQECDLISGADCFFSILKSGKIVGKENEPVAQNTIFGWVVAGKIEPDRKSFTVIKSHYLGMDMESNTDVILQKFWENEEFEVKKSFLTEEEKFCEQHFQAIYKITPEKRFEVMLPVYGDLESLGSSKTIALSRLFAMERKFQLDRNLETEYKSFMKQYEELGQMEPVEQNVSFIDRKLYHQPHHAVIKGDSISTKLRVVFDGSCKPSNLNALNAILADGKIHPNLISLQFS